MNKKRVFVLLLLLLMLLPSSVYAVNTGEVCVDNIRYRITNYDNSDIFPLAPSVRKAEIEMGFFWGLRFGQTYEGKILLAPEYYINGLKKIRDENKERFSDEEYNKTCLKPIDVRRGMMGPNQTYFGEESKKQAIICKIAKSTDAELESLSIDIANRDWQALNKRFGIENAWQTLNGMYNIEEYNKAPNYFSYNGHENEYKFHYRVESSDFRCLNTIDSKPYVAAKEGSATFWMTGAFEYKSCPDENEEKANVDFNLEKVTVEWDFPQSKWVVTIPEVKGLALKFIKKDHWDSDMDFVHLPFGAAATNYNYDINETCCIASKEKVDCSGCTTEGTRYKNVSRTVNGNRLTVTLNPDSGESIFYVGSYNVGGNCDGADLMWHQLSIPKVVENPYINTKASKYCSDYIKAMEGFGYPVSFAYAMVPECNKSTKMINTADVVGIWSSETEAYGTYGGETNVVRKINSVIAEYKGHSINNLARKGNTACEFNMDGDNQGINIKKADNGVNIATYSYTSLLYNDDSHIYWNAICTEEITLSYLGPRALGEAGAGFTYPIEVQQVRKCSPYQIKKPVSKPVCSYGIECYGGPAYHTGQGGAGPNEDFDNCVLSCDGGEYSQSCINMCYESVYGSKDTILGLAWGSNKFTKVETDPLQGVCKNVRVEDDPKGNIGAKFTFTREIDNSTYKYTTKAPISSCDIITGNGSRGNTKCDNYACVSEHGVKYTYLSGCNSKSGTQGTACFEVFTSETDCLPVNYGGRRVNDAHRLIPEDIYNSTFKDSCAQNDMKCYQQVSYAEAVNLAEEEYNDIIKDIKEFKDNPANTSNFYTIILNNNANKEFKFKGEEYTNVMYRVYDESENNFSNEYDLGSLNMRLDDSNYKKYVKTTTTSGESKAFGGAGGLYENLDFGSYSKFYEKYDFYKYRDSNKKDLPGFTIERNYVFNLPDVLVDGGYTSDSNRDYFEAYEYSMNKTGDKLSKYPNMFMSYAPDMNGLNALDIITEGTERSYSWRRFYNTGAGVAGLKQYASAENKPDINWENIRFTYSLGTWNQVSENYNTEKGLTDERRVYNDITCFYGLPPCDEGDCPTECEDGKCETTYIFRPIELTNMFPCNDGTCNGKTNSIGIAERNPRFNWTDEAKTQYEKSYYVKQGVYNYKVDPKLVQDNIEQKGEDIYNSDNLNEIDYDFTISKEQIRAIRNYSVDGKKLNFGDYSTMECEKNDITKMNVCRSTFLRNNGKYITYTKLGTLGCNNQKNGDECE